MGPVKVGRWSMVGAGSVVSADVMPYSLVLGIPAVHVDWVGRTGKRLVEKDGVLVCPDSGDIFRESEGMLVMLDTA